MKKFLSAFGVALVSMLILDFVWIGYIASSFYKNEMGAYYSSTPLLWPAAIFYLIYVAGLVYFVIAPSLAGQLKSSGTKSAHAWYVVALKGAFFALVAFCTYDLTNLSIIPHWPVILSVVDMAWGTVEGAIVATVTFLILRNFKMV